MTARSRTHSLCCIPVEGAVTALGYFQASLSVTGIFIVLRVIIYNLNYLSNVSDNPYHRVFVREMSVLFLVLASCLTLAIFLIVGVKKRRPGYVLGYLILGLLKTIALTGCWAVRVHNYYFIYEDSIEIFLLLLVYSVFLVMVYLVYRNIKLEKEPNDMIYNTFQNYAGDVKKKDVV